MSRRLIEKTRGRLSRETGTIHRTHAGNIRFALAFSNTYYVGMSSLGFQIVYGLLNDTDGSMCERVFLPDPPELAELRRTGDSLITMESQTAVRDFDVVAFSVSFELDYPNLLRILALSRIDEVAGERGPDQPLVIAGGPAVTFNPEPLAPFVDAFVLGEAEEVLPEIVGTLREMGFHDREELLRALSRIEGVYVPSLYRPIYHADGTTERTETLNGAPERISRRWVRRLEDFDAVTVITTPDTEFSNMLLAEVARGCGRQCRFCAAGYAFLPPRARSAESVLSALGVRWLGTAVPAAEFDEVPRQGGVEPPHPEGGGGAPPRAGLVSASVFDHPSSLLICKALLERERLFSISSMRADTLNRDIAETLRRGGHETLTIAPEAGTERLRLVLNKGMPDDEILRAVTIAWDAGFRRIKLYFMVGLPTETAEDIDGIADLAARIARMFPWEKVIVSVSCFVPKPWTPFQWAPMDEERSLSGKRAVIRRALGPVKPVEVVGESPRESVVQGVLARGDRRLRDALLIVAREDANWREAFRRTGIDPHFYAQRPRREDEVFPWDHLDLGVRKDYLRSEYERAISAAVTPQCKVGACRRCGVCRE